MPRFSDRSKNRLNTCDPRLQEILHEAIKYFDFTVLEGHRDKETQERYFNERKTKVHYPNSKHNSNPSLAVDIVPYYPDEPHIRWKSIKGFAYMAGLINGIATSKGYKLRWGGNWNGEVYIPKQRFDDLPHFEILE